jgi:AraC family transcriptional regulator of adaptative response/methylated-DNA-[protein]-cysteine methyltransferase
MNKLLFQPLPNAWREDIHYSEISTDVGPLFAAETEQGLCQLSFLVNGHRQEPLETLKKHWPRAKIQPGKLQCLPASTTLKQLLASPPPLHLCGTDFQQSVWLQLLKIPVGQTSSYGRIARQINKARASRAVGQAVGANPVAILVPCHRVLGADGQIGHYHWGPAIKQRLLQAEGMG